MSLDGWPIVAEDDQTDEAFDMLRAMGVLRETAYPDGARFYEFVPREEWPADDYAEAREAVRSVLGDALVRAIGPPGRRP